MGHDSTMWKIVWVSPQGHTSVSVSHSAGTAVCLFRAKAVQQRALAAGDDIDDNGTHFTGLLFTLVAWHTR